MDRIIRPQESLTPINPLILSERDLSSTYLRDSAVKVEDVALCLVVPDRGLILQLQQPIQVLALVLLCAVGEHGCSESN